MRGVDAVLAWQSSTTTVELKNQKPRAGPGWAATRWTIKQVFPTGVELAVPGVTVMEVRGGRVVRMTLVLRQRGHRPAGVKQRLCVARVADGPT